MLVLSRKIQETIQVGEVTFTIVRIGGDRVRVGIDAPRDQAILRGELEKNQGNIELAAEGDVGSKKHLTEASR